MLALRRKMILAAVRASLGEAIEDVHKEDKPPVLLGKSSKSSTHRKGQISEAVFDAMKEHKEAVEAAAPKAASQTDAEVESETNDPNPDAANRLKPLPGSTTKKPVAPPQKVVAPKPHVESTEVSLKSDSCKKKRSSNEDASGSYLGQNDCEAE